MYFLHRIEASDALYGVLYLEKKTGTGTTHVHIESLPVHITAQENEYNEAYTKRWLAWGGGNEQFLWSSFKEIKTNLYLQEKVVELENKIVDPTPVGTIVMWSGNSIPPAMATKWRFCNGTELSKTEYPELYAVIGNTYGGGSTHFFIPNLRGKFPVGAASGDADFNWNKTAGARTVTLQTNQLPDFSMSLPTRIGGDDNNHSDTEGLAHGDLGSTHTLFHFNFPVKYSRNKETGQYGQAIKILPPYLTLGFIIKVK